MKHLFIVATPIGNLGDITLRALEILKSANLIMAEDTRRTKILLNHYEIAGKPLTACHAQTKPETIEKIFRGFSEENLVYVSDAGTPGISDPGYRVVREAMRQDFTIVPIPGPSAMTTLISVAGVPVNTFQFLGFLPHKKGRKTIIDSLESANISTIFYESVHRFPKLLDELSAALGDDRVIVVGRELTKLYEEIFRGNLAEARENFDTSNTKGEFVVIVAPVGFGL